MTEETKLDKAKDALGEAHLLLDEATDEEVDGRSEEVITELNDVVADMEEMVGEIRFINNIKNLDEKDVTINPEVANG